MSETPPLKRLYIKTYGCQMNVYDSERMADVLRPLGYGVTDSPEGADLVVLNTCHIRERASEKVFSELGKLKAMKADGYQVEVPSSVDELQARILKGNAERFGSAASVVIKTGKRF